MERPFPAYKGDAPYLFVSYAHADAERVYPELVWLREQGFNVWYDEGISPGSTWRDEVALALTQCSVFLYFVTPNSVQSRNCLNEVNFALSRERKILSVHLAPTELPVGLELSLSAMQAIIRGDQAEQAYRTKLSDGLKSFLPIQIQPIALPGVGEDRTKQSRKSIAVVPLVNRSNDPNNEYLCDGITEELIGGLSKVEGLKVASQLSAFAVKGQTLDVSAMGDRLKVEHILSGSVQKAGNRVRISVLLSLVADGSSLWSDRYDGEVEDIFELQEDVARKVVDALKVELGAQQQRKLVDVGTNNLDAYNLFLLGRQEARKRNPQSLKQAIVHFERAAELDPSFARTHWWAHRCYADLVALGTPREEVIPKAEAALRRAQETGFVPPGPWHIARRFLYPEERPDMRTRALEAIEVFRKPDPEWRSYENSALARCLMGAGLFQGTLLYLERYFSLVQIDLSDTEVMQSVRYLLSHLERFDEAIERWTELIAARPDDPIILGERALLYSRTGQYEKAERDITELSKVLPRNFAQFYHLYWRRELDAAKGYFDWLEPRRNLHPIYKVWGCALLGDMDGALDHFEELDSRQSTDPNMIRIQTAHVLPRSIYREFEQQPRFQAVLRKYGLDDEWRDELIGMANELTDVTGIHVQLDEANQKH